LFIQGAGGRKRESFDGNALKHSDRVAARVSRMLRNYGVRLNNW